MIVVDASIVYSVVCEDGGAGRAARERITGEELVAPHVVDLEVLSAMRGRVRRRELSTDRALTAIADLEELEIVLVPHHPHLRRAWELRDNVTSYDAVYVALAELLGVVLLTADARLAAAPGIHCHVEVLATPA